MSSLLQQLPENNRSFDYIIVGGGSAGCVIANRLVQANKTVALLEAGPSDNSVLISTPGLLGVLLGQCKQFSWNYFTSPQKQLNGRKLFWPRGKTLGGTSSVNAMVYSRGHPEDYESWNIPGWKWDDMLPHFISTENQKDMKSVDSQFHGVQGELSVCNQIHTNPLSHLFVKAAHHEGELLTRDFNGTQQEGFGLYQVTQSNGKRSSSSTAFLPTSIKQKSNLKIITNAIATKLIFHPDDPKKVRGVRIVDNRVVSENSSKEELQANEAELFANEVIVACGAVNSPKLLLLSGIGPEEELAQNGIDLVHHLPGVGKNLQDHPDVVVHCREKGFLSYGKDFSFRCLWQSIRDFFQYVFRSTGSWATNGAEAGGYIKSSFERNGGRPDIQFHFCPASFESHTLGLKMGYGFALHACVLRPKSRGSITLQSNHPLAHPDINPNFLSHPDDVKILLEGLKKCRHYLNSKILAPHLGRIETPNDSLQSDEELIEWIQSHTDTAYHTVGTCKMGTPDDDMAVVTPDLKVVGIEGLRVADTSIMPLIVSANTNAAAIAIGEKCASILLAAERN
jgi:choline dehydrogenase